MRVLIIHPSYQKIQFLKNGLYYQNIYTTELPMDESICVDRVSAALHDCNGAVFFVKNTVQARDVFACIKELRHKRPGMPCIIFDDTCDQEVKAVAVQYGAALYVTRPYIFSEIGNEIKKIIYQKTRLNGNKILQYGDLKLDTHNRIATRKNKIIPLRNKEFALLEFLMTNKENVLTRDTIVDYVWDHNARLLSNTIDVHIGLLRKKIDRGEEAKLIHTVHCIGYKFGGQSSEE